MAEVVIVEVLGRQGRVKERHRLSSFPATIGRAYSNDIILDDPRISARHLEIDRDADGRLEIRDLGSKAGILLASPHDKTQAHRRVEGLRLEGDSTIRVGRTVLRFRDPSCVVEPTVALELEIPSGSILEKRWSLSAFLSLAMGIVALQSYLETYGELKEDLSILITFMVLITIWSAGWAVASKVSGHASHFLSHATIVCSAVLMGIAAHLLSEYTAFAFSSGTLGRAIAWTLNPLLIGWVLYRHLRLCASTSEGRLRITAVATSAVLIALFLAVQELGRPEFNQSLDYPGQLKPPMFKLSNERSLERIFSDARELKEKVDALARKANEEAEKRE